MQAQAYEGYVENGRFYPRDNLTRLPGRFRAVLTVVLENPLQEVPQTNSLEWLDELHHLLDESGDEKLRMENFPRMDFGRNPIIFTDEG